MKPRDLLLAALRNQVTPRPAWVPFVGVHGARLLGCTATEYLKSKDLLVRGVTRAAELYRADGVPVAFDLQLEAEILGCQIQWSDQTPPAVKTHPLETAGSIKDLPPFDLSAGRLPAVLGATEELKRTIGGEVGIYGLICGPFTLALHLMGSDIFMQMFDHPDYVKGVLGYCSGIASRMAQGYLDHGADIIAVVDPMTSQISPEHFEEFCSARLNEVFDVVAKRGALSSLFVCGDATRNIERMCHTGADSLSIDENIPLERVRDFTRVAGKAFGGNLRLTSVLLLGDEDDARLDAIRCIDIGATCGFVLAPGCDLPYATPPENLVAVADMVHDSYRREVAKRTIVARTGAEEAGRAKVPAYKTQKSVYLDVITLDSSSCAPCQYMMDAVHRAARQVSQPVVVREHRITTREGLGMMMALGVKNLPTICIDGEAKFISVIPDLRTLVKAIQDQVDAKSIAQG